LCVALGRLVVERRLYLVAAAQFGLDVALALSSVLVCRPFLVSVFVVCHPSFRIPDGITL